MFNDFVLVGPAADPAGINGLRDTVEALRRYRRGRGARRHAAATRSGTHARGAPPLAAGGRRSGRRAARSWYARDRPGHGPRR